MRKPEAISSRNRIGRGGKPEKSRALDPFAVHRPFRTSSRVSPAVLWVLCGIAGNVFLSSARPGPAETVAEISATVSAAWADVPSYAYVLETTLASPDGPVTIREERAFARPDAWVSEMTVVAHPNASSKGTVVRSIARGDRAWQISRSAPGSGAAAVERLRKEGGVPAEKLDEYAREVEIPRVIAFDLARLRAAGIGPEDFLFANQPHDPLRDLDPASIRVEKADAKSWTLIGKAKRGGKLPKATGLVRLAIDRATLELRTVETLGEGDAAVATTKVERIDRAAGMPASRFEFVAPEGAKTTDNTEIVLKSAAIPRTP